MLKKIISHTFSISLLAAALPSFAAEHSVLFLPNANDKVRQGLIRVSNNSNEEGTVNITGTDMRGNVGGALSFTIAANETINFNSEDLQLGNADKGLENNLGDGRGAWRLNLESDLDLDVLAFVTGPDGFFNSVHDAVAEQDGVYNVPVFNPASNTDQVSVLRVTNMDTNINTVQLSGIDDSGNSFGPVSLDIDGSRTLALTAQDIEYGNAGKGLVEGLGDGSGKWRLQISASAEVSLLNLLVDQSGNLTNLSSDPRQVEPTVAPIEQPFLLVSDNFDNGDPIPRAQACSEKSGSNQSPDLSWSGAPADTASFALIMEDEISPCGTGTQACVHWNVVNIPLATNNLAEGDISESGATENSSGYYGPCPPNNHVYNFTLYALSDDMPNLTSGNIGRNGITRTQFESNYSQYIIEKTTLSGSYK